MNGGISTNLIAVNHQQFHWEQRS